MKLTPKEKAIELVDRFRIFAHTGDYDYEFYGAKNDNYNAKQCALIAVDEIFQCCIGSHEDYWQEVKQEIEKL